MAAHSEPRRSEEQGEAQVVDFATGEVLDFSGTSVPLAQLRDVLASRDAKAEEVRALNKALAREHAHARKLQAQVDDLLEQAADRETVKTCLEFWRAKTGRSARTRVDLASGRARHVRWILRHWSPREFCLAVVGLMATPWFVERGVTDVPHLCQAKGVYCEGRFEEFLRAGRAAIGEAEPDE